MAADIPLKDNGSRSGEIFAGKVKLWTLNKQKWLTLEIDTSGNLLLTNLSGSTATVTLS